MGRSQFCSFSRYSASTACVGASDASCFLNSADVSRLARGRMISSSSSVTDSGTGVSSFLLYLEPHCGLAPREGHAHDAVDELVQRELLVDLRPFFSSLPFLPPLVAGDFFAPALPPFLLPPFRALLGHLLAVGRRRFFIVACVFAT